MIDFLTRILYLTVGKFYVCFQKFFWILLKFFTSFYANFDEKGCQLFILSTSWCNYNSLLQPLTLAMSQKICYQNLGQSFAWNEWYWLTKNWKKDKILLLFLIFQYWTQPIHSKSSQVRHNIHCKLAVNSKLEQSCSLSNIILDRTALIPKYLP